MSTTAASQGNFPVAAAEGCLLGHDYCPVVGRHDQRGRSDRVSRFLSSHRSDWTLYMRLSLILAAALGCVQSSLASLFVATFVFVCTYVYSLRTHKREEQSRYLVRGFGLVTVNVVDLGAFWENNTGSSFPLCYPLCTSCTHLPIYNRWLNWEWLVLCALRDIACHVCPSSTLFKQLPACTRGRFTNACRLSRSRCC